ncbi:MAG: N-acetyltransferase [Bacteroidetes bacterium]|nr:MAG: N-acetyltransferase [Bacteroidota bacterium]
MENLRYEPFSTIDIHDPFFDSLKQRYREFEDWYGRKSTEGEMAYVLRTDLGNIEGFMYLKIEIGVVDDVVPSLPDGKHLKVGTFKFYSHGTRRGERFLKKVFDHAMFDGVDDVYVTVFDEHAYLIELFQRYGFRNTSRKTTENGVENCLVRSMKSYTGNVMEDYPYIATEGANKYLLAIEPEYHTRMLPDSILNNESPSLIQDISHTNSIHKVYLSGAYNARSLKTGDLLVMYRKKPNSRQQAYGRFTSVVTTIGVVESVRDINEFSSFYDFRDYCISYSIFNEKELARFYREKRFPYIIKFTYNCAMQKRIIRDRLINEVGLDPDVRWTLLPLSNTQFSHIFRLGEIHEGFIIN